MKNMKEQNQKTIYELKCVVCRKICGTITFPSEAKVDLNELYKLHQTLCDEHMLKDRDIKP